MNLRYLLFCFLATLGACSDVIVPDIRNKSVQIIFPGNDFISNTQVVDFIWEPLENADNYRIRIVSPSFDSLQKIWVDEEMEDTRAQYTLPEGAYEWTIEGQNEAYRSKDCCRYQLTIQSDSSQELGDQTLVLIAPADDWYTKLDILEFQWEPLQGAGQYVFQWSKSPFFTDIDAFKTLNASATSLQPGTDGVYYWRVRAENQQTLSFTPWSQRRVTIDRQAPAAPGQIFPGSGDTIQINQQNPDLRWESDTDSEFDSLFIYNNAQRAILIQKARLINTEINLDPTIFGSSGIPEDYWWELRTFDRAGNVSAWSTFRRFWIK